MTEQTSEDLIELALKAKTAEWRSAHALTAIALLLQQANFIHGNY